MTRGRWLVVAALALAAAALVLGGAGPAAATPFLDAADAEDLAQLLAEASAVQGVCYGWTVDLQDDSGGPSGIDAGSDRGVGRPPSQIPECRRYLEVRAVVRWTAETSDAEDSGGFTVDSIGIDDPPTESDVRSVLDFEGSDLVKDDGDVLLYQAVAALPRLLADRGAVPSLTLAPAPTPPPAGSRPTGSALPDWMRQRAGLLALGGLLLGFAVAGVAVGGVLRGAERRRAADAAAPRRPHPELRLHGAAAGAGPPAAPGPPIRPGPASSPGRPGEPGEPEPHRSGTDRPDTDQPDTDQPDTDRGAP
ncbi:MAG TPA: hypothetical protein VE547_17345 [Mycobacteriales bacterium]|nr:hypothetical protein [Mycobacteriales bacterium]